MQKRRREGTSPPSPKPATRPAASRLAPQPLRDDAAGLTASPSSSPVELEPSPLHHADGRHHHHHHDRRDEEEEERKERDLERRREEEEEEQKQEEQGFVEVTGWRERCPWPIASSRPWNPTLRATVGLRDLMDGVGRRLKKDQGEEDGAEEGQRQAKRRRTSLKPTSSMAKVAAMTKKKASSHEEEDEEEDRLWRICTSSAAGEVDERYWTDGSTGELLLNRLPPSIRLNGRFRPVRMIGEGTFSQLLDAIDEWRAPPSSYSATSDGKLHVAIKIMKAPYHDPELLSTYWNIGSQEAAWIRQLNRDDPDGMSHTVRLHSTFQFAGHFCLVLELLKSSLRHSSPPLQSLDDHLQRFSQQPSSTSSSSSSSTTSSASPRIYTLPEVRSIAVQLLTSLSFLRNRRIIHADIKPENIAFVPPPPADVWRRTNLYDHSANYFPIYTPPNIRLIDFGNAIPLLLTTDELSSQVQSVPYRAPEVLWGYAYDEAIDMWSVGCVLYELVTGELLFPPAANAGGNVEVLEESLKAEMTALLGGEAEVICDSSEERWKERHFAMTASDRRMKGEQRQPSSSEDHQQSASSVGKRRHKRTKVIYWDQVLSDGYRWKKQGRSPRRTMTGTEAQRQPEAQQPNGIEQDSVLLSYRKGDKVHIFGRKSEDYWKCWLRGKEGLIPAAHLRLLAPFRCASAEHCQDEFAEEQVGEGEMPWKATERELRRKQVDITLRRLLKQMRISDVIFADFLMQFLIYDPSRRYTPQEALRHRFLVPFFPFKAVFPELANDVLNTTQPSGKGAEKASPVKLEPEMSSPEVGHRHAILDDRQRAIDVRESQLLERERLVSERESDVAEERKMAMEAMHRAERMMALVDERSRLLDEEKKTANARMQENDHERMLVDNARKEVFLKKERLRQLRRDIDKDRRVNEEAERRLAQMKDEVEDKLKTSRGEEARLLDMKELLEKEKAANEAQLRQIASFHHEKEEFERTRRRETERLVMEKESLQRAKDEVERERGELDAALKKAKARETQARQLMQEAEDQAKYNRELESKLAREQELLREEQARSEAERTRLAEEAQRVEREKASVREALEKATLSFKASKEQEEKWRRESEQLHAQFAKKNTELEEERWAFEEEKRAEEERLEAEREEVERMRAQVEADRAAVQERQEQLKEKSRRMMTKQMNQMEEWQREKAELEAACKRHADEIELWKAQVELQRQQQQTASARQEGRTSSPVSSPSPWPSPSPALAHRQQLPSPLASLLRPSGRFAPAAPAARSPAVTKASPRLKLSNAPLASSPTKPSSTHTSPEDEEILLIDESATTATSTKTTKKNKTER